MDWIGDKDAPGDNKPVVNMTEHQARMRYAPLSQIEGYWNALRGTRLLPLRSEIDPRGLKGALEYCFVLERIAPGLARLRVAGSHLGDLMGMEVRGMPISSFLTSASRQEFGKTLEEVFERPATATISLKAETGFGRPALHARMLLLPVRSDLGDTSRILGGFMTDGDIGRVPRRFTLQEIDVQGITGRDVPAPSTPRKLRVDDFRAIEGAEDTRTFKTLQPKRPTGMSEGTEKFEQALPGVPYLRVVK